MDYQKALLRLNRLIDYEKLPFYDYKRSCKLDRIRRLLLLLDSPEKKFSSVIIAGTKGKGSTASTLSSILTSAGIKTAVYTSPHLVSVRERIKIDSRNISPQEFAREFSLIEKTIYKNDLRGLTFFEILTALAFLYFARKKIDIAVLEAGLGGRLDATNIVNPLISVITPISYDHMHLLGWSLKDITKEKCGIIKDDSFLVSAPQPKEALRVIKRACLQKRARLILAGKKIDSRNIRISFSGTSFDTQTQNFYYKGLRTPLIGRHQAINSLIAIGTAQILKENFNFDIKRADIKAGLKDVKLLGRFQIVSRAPYIILDGAHNKASAESLRDTLLELFGSRKILLILGISSDKDIEGIGRTLCPLAKKIIFTKANSPRAEDPCNLAKRLGEFCRDYYVCGDAKDAISFAKEFVKKEDIIVITGSLFLVGDALKVFR